MPPLKYGGMLQRPGKALTIYGNYAIIERYCIMSNYKQEGIKKMTKALLGAGFRVFIAKDGEGEYGFYTDKDGSRILSFQYDCCDISFSGNYNSTKSGSGWRLDGQDASYEDMFAEAAPYWAIGNDPKWSYRTLEQQQDRYQSSSKYKEIIS